MLAATLMVSWPAGVRAQDARSEPTPRTGLGAGGSEAAGSNGAPTEVRGVMTRALPDGCRYRAIVMGQLAPSPHAGSGGRALATSLRVSADVVCPEVALSAPTRPVVTADIDADALAEMLAALGAVHTSTARESCEYAPAFNVTRAGITLETVVRACTPSLP